MEFSFLDEPRGAAPTPADLSAVGVVCEHLPPGSRDAEARLSDLMDRRGYGTRDEVCLEPDTPDLSALLDKFAREHRHDDDEVRYVLEGAGIFDVRDRSDRWIRIEVGPGDLVVLPAGLYHRFFLTEDRRIRCVRLYKDPSGWVPHYR